ARALGTGVSNDPLAALDPNRDIIVSKTTSYVKIMFRDRMMFATASSRLQPSARAKVQKVGQVLANYPQTVVGVAGFTDNVGSYSYNLDLSKRRASSVSNLLAVNGRPFTKGCSYNKAIVPNDSARNRALNRRVEVYLYADRNRMTDPCR
ncbi:MAG: OmpA family protein, partial [Sulfurovum sp.]|nr:OmpA family protein [Sulfurovum sp.]